MSSIWDYDEPPEDDQSNWKKSSAEDVIDEDGENEQEYGQRKKRKGSKLDKQPKRLTKKALPEVCEVLLSDDSLGGSQEDFDLLVLGETKPPTAAAGPSSSKLGAASASGADTGNGSVSGSGAAAGGLCAEDYLNPEIVRAMEKMTQLANDISGAMQVHLSSSPMPPVKTSASLRYQPHSTAGADMLQQRATAAAASPAAPAAEAETEEAGPSGAYGAGPGERKDDKDKLEIVCQCKLGKITIRLRKGAHAHHRHGCMLWLTPFLSV